jgi:hypothetical protein
MPRPCTCDRCTIGSPYIIGDCRNCWLFHNDPRYAAHWSNTCKSRSINIAALSRKHRAAKHTHSRGLPGTELKKLLSWFHDPDSPTEKSCKCNERAAIMDRHGYAWCEKNIELIVGWLKESAAIKGFPFFPFAARQVVNLAISRAKTAATAAKTANQ